MGVKSYLPGQRPLAPRTVGGNFGRLSFLLAQLPYRRDTAAANMADDHLLLESATPGLLWLRHYGWSGPALSFGVFQSLAWVNTARPDGSGECVLVRRPTGGGLVDHRHDWTYTLVVPAGHPLADGPATETYRLVHGVLAETLAALSVPATLAPCAKACGLASAPATAPTVCFQRPETHDVIRPGKGSKIAGAALRRLRHGLLLQGSVDASALSGVTPEGFQAAFAANLARMAGAELGESPWPFSGDDPRRADLAAHYRSEAWTSRR